MNNWGGDKGDDNEKKAPIHRMMCIAELALLEVREEKASQG